MSKRWGKLAAVLSLLLLLTATHRERPSSAPAGGARLIGRGTDVPRLSAVFVAPGFNAAPAPL